MHISPLLGPIVALVAWTLVMMIWMMAARFPLVRGRDIPDGARGADLERAEPGPRHWPAHNYAHLMEQPTVFYAIVFALILMGFDARINVYLAWTYVGLRVAHSLIQATTNKVSIRFPLFALSSLCLFALTVHAAIFMIHHG
jgi:hypothetical protein